MDCKINWTNRAWLSYSANIEYLQKIWTAKEVSNFIMLADKRIAGLMKYPKTGSSRNKSYPNIRCVVIHKRVLLIYKYKPHKNEIDLLVFWNTYQNARKLRVK
jgi:plasmid stabilization system protein ParE